MIFVGYCDGMQLRHNCLPRETSDVYYGRLILHQRPRRPSQRQRQAGACNGGHAYGAWSRAFVRADLVPRPTRHGRRAGRPREFRRPSHQGHGRALGTAFVAQCVPQRCCSWLSRAPLRAGSLFISTLGTREMRVASLFNDLWCAATSSRACQLRPRWWPCPMRGELGHDRCSPCTLLCSIVFCSYFLDFTNYAGQYAFRQAWPNAISPAVWNATGYGGNQARHADAARSTRRYLSLNVAGVPKGQTGQHAMGVLVCTGERQLDLGHFTKDIAAIINVSPRRVQYLYPYETDVPFYVVNSMYDAASVQGILQLGA
jgi:hypothetical protein